MAVKTITIDMEAYELLSVAKEEGESFSKVIKRRMNPVKTARGLREALPTCLLSSDVLDNLEKVVASRTDSMVNSPAIDAGH